MKEFEKDEILDEEELSSDFQAEAEDVFEATEPDEEDYDGTDEAHEETDGLAEELESIREMFQQELDKASQEDEEGVIIQELEDITYEEEDEEIPEEELCECCGERARSKEYGEGYPYCEDCRNLMKKYPLRSGAVIMTILMLAVFVGSVYFSFPYMNDSLTVADASSYYQSGKIMSALQSYYSYFNGGKSGEAISKRAFNEILDGYLKTGYQTDAATLIQTYYDEDALSKPWNKKYADIINESTVLSETYKAVYDITYDALSGAAYDYDAVMAELDALKEVNPIEEGTSTVTAKYNEVFIEYYKYVVMSTKGESLEKQLEQLKAIDAVGEGYEWVYLSNYCAIAARCGEEDIVNSTFERIININAQDMNAYSAKASYYRYLDKPDADKIIEICQEAQKVATTNDISYKHSLAIAYLLKGEGALALEEIKAIFDAGAYTVQNCNLYALCGLYTGDEEIYNDMAALLTSYGYKISDLVTEYKDGKITIEEVLKDKGGDI